MSVELAPRRICTEDDYFAFELSSARRHQFHEGRVTELGSGGTEHDEIVLNLGASLATRLGETSSWVLDANNRIKVEATSFITYADVSVVCGPLEIARRSGVGVALLNPTVLFEVLSAETEGFDRGKKFRFYREIPSLRAYVLVAYDQPWVEVWTWSEPRSATAREYRGLEEAAEIPAAGIILPLAEIYHDVPLVPPAVAGGSGSRRLKRRFTRRLPPAGARAH